MSNPNPFIEIEESRKLHDRLVQCDIDLRDLDDNPFRYTVAEVNERRKAIILLREQTRRAIEEMQG